MNSMQILVARRAPEGSRGGQHGLDLCGVGVGVKARKKPECTCTKEKRGEEEDKGAMRE